MPLTADADSALPIAKHSTPGAALGAARASSAPSAADRTALAVVAPAGAGSAASRFSPPPIPPLETLGGHSVSAIEQRALVQRSGSAPAAAAQLALDSREPPVEPEVRSCLLRIVARQRMIDHSELRTKADRLVRATRDQNAQLLLAVASCLTGPAAREDPRGGGAEPGRSNSTLTAGALSASGVQLLSDAERKKLVAEHAKYLGVDPEREPHLMWVAERALGTGLPIGWSTSRSVCMFA
eukprot:tig00021720_g23174.t1